MSRILDKFEQLFRNILANLTKEEISGLLLQIQAGNWQPAYKKLIEKMNTAELCELQYTINAEFHEANTRNATMVEIQQRLIFGILEGWLLGYKAVL